MRGIAGRLRNDAVLDPLHEIIEDLPISVGQDNRQRAGADAAAMPDARCVIVPEPLLQPFEIGRSVPNVVATAR